MRSQGFESKFEIKKVLIKLFYLVFLRFLNIKSISPKEKIYESEESSEKNVVRARLSALRDFSLLVIYLVDILSTQYTEY